MIRLFFFVGLGLVLGAAVVQVVGPPGAGVWGFPVGLMLSIVCGVFVLIARSMRGVLASMASPEQIEQARNGGRMGLARVESLRQTGTQINDQPVCDIDVVVRMQGGDAFRTTSRRILEVTEIPRYQPGTVHVVAQIAEDRPALAFTDDDPTAQVWSLTTVPTDGSGVRTWTLDGDVAANGRRPLLGMGSRGRPLRLALFAAATVLAATAVVYPYRVGLGQTIDALGEGRLHPEVRDPAVLADAIGQLRDALGHDQVVDVHVSSDLISVEAPLEPGELAADAWIYRRGHLERQGPATIQPSTVKEQFSLGDVAWERFDGLVERAVDEADLRGPVEAWIGVSRATNDDVESDDFSQSTGEVELTISVDGDYGSASFRAAADGSGMRRIG